jgi:hypothetical protein
MIKFDLSPVSAVLNLMEDVAAGRSVPDEVIRNITQMEAYQFFLTRYREMNKMSAGVDDPGLSIENLEAVFRCYGDGTQLPAGLPRPLVTMHENLVKNGARLTDLRRVEAGLKSLAGRVPAIQESVLERLPGRCRLDTTIYILPEAHTNAYQHAGRIVVSFFPLTVDDQGVKLSDRLLGSTLAHELHHVGLGSIEESEAPGSVALLHSILGGFMGEGAATWFFNLPLSGELKEKWDYTALHLPELFARLHNILAEGPSMAEDGLMQVFWQEFMGFYQDRGYPGVYVVGVYCCRLIDEQAGRAALVNSLVNPREFVEVYERSRKNAGVGDEYQLWWPGN